jgi:hypothetical protein
MLGEQSQRLPRLEPRQQRKARATGHRGVQRDGLTERVEQRQPAEDDVVWGELEQVATDNLRIASQVGMCELGTLRLAGGT